MSIVQKIASKFFDKKRSKSIDSPFVMWQQAITQMWLLRLNSYQNLPNFPC